ncbi:MAG TPA: PaaI family thioesterase [Acidimicrobiales bacterium]
MPDLEARVGTARIRSLKALTLAVRGVVDGAMRTGLGAAEIDVLTRRAERLAKDLHRVVDDDPRTVRSHGPGLSEPGSLYATNPALGSCNPIAPDVRIDVAEDGTVRGSVCFGLAHVGPPGLAHGGVIASVLDQVLGIAGQVAGHPGMTVELAVRFRRPTPIEQVLALESRHLAANGRRSEAWGAIYDGQGRVAAEATAVFILPLSTPDASVSE